MRIEYLFLMMLIIILSFIAGKSNEKPDVEKIVTRVHKVLKHRDVIECKEDCK